MTRNEIIKSLLAQAKDKSALAHGDSDSIFAEDAQALYEAVVILKKKVVPMDFHERCLDLEIKRRIDAEAKIPRWHDAKKEQPEENGVYLCVIVVTCEGKEYKWQELWVFNDDGWVTNNTTTVTHWMPLPEMPKEGEA